jgi:glycosyltransferase involved in cell wall biosynthesis|tara:strand:+ start:638 stop:1921 length:1284 start_codon:yes stop_codon:yes gene_type:complete
MSKPRFVISCPFDTYSGYGARSRDIVKAIIELDKYKVELLPQRWGETSWGFCKDHPEWEFLYKHKAGADWQKSKPELWMQITIPNEFQPVGKYNIGLTAGIEATACKAEWIEGLNRMDINWVSSNFAKQTFEQMSYDQKDQRTGQVVRKIKLEKPVEVIFEGVDLTTYKPIKQSEIKTIDLSDIKEEFCYLFVGHWMQGEYGHDRKNVGVLVNSFYNAFKNKIGKKPALILKCSAGVASYLSRDSILDKIKHIKKSVGSSNLPNVYLLHGEFDDSEMNELYNHSKIKAMVSFTKGEGFGRPLLEFSTTGKPIIASGWSGHIDFLDKNSIVLLGGRLENVHDSAANNWLIKEAQWFQVEPKQGISALKEVYKKYKQYSKRSKKQRHYAKTNFSWDKMKELVGKKLDNTPNIPTQVQLQLPKLELPKLS